MQHLKMDFLPAWPPLWPSAVAFGALAFLSLALGEAAARWLRLPRLLGYLAAGGLFGAGGQLFAELRIEGLPQRSLEFALDFATAFVLFDLGQRVSFGWLRRNPALLATSVAEAAATFLAVFGALRLLAGTAPLPAALLGTIAIASSPGVALAVTREVRAQGQVTERSLLLVALNCTYAVVLSTLLLGWVQVEARGGLDLYVLHPLYLTIGSLLLAACGAALLRLALAGVGHDRAAQVMTMLALVAIVFGVATALRLSQLLALLACGALARLFDRRRRLVSTEFGVMAAFILMLYFALSGAVADFAAPVLDWRAGLVLLAARALGKTGAVGVLGRFSGVNWRQGVWTGAALLPMSTVAILLARQVAQVDARLGAPVMAVVVFCAVVMQVGGALLLAFVLRRSGEARAA